MTTPTPRWTAETEDLLHRTLHDLDVRINNLTGDHHCNLVTQVVLTALADAGVLMPVGSETRQEIEVQTAGLRYPCSDLARAWRQFGELKAKGYDAQIVQRDVHTGPWREVTDDPDQ